jgi:hypothetical protein
MTDSIQRTSTLPLPDFQTNQGDLDPLPTDSPRRINQDLTQRADFAAYLNQSSITNVQLNTRSLLFDTVQEIQQNSAYQHPPSNSPI